MTQLQKRIDTFSKMTSCFKHNKIHDLIVSYNIDDDLDILKAYVLAYMVASINYKKVDDVFEYYEEFYYDIKNITPNGLIVPKRHTILEYNLLNRAFYNIIKKLKIDNYITSWHVPLNLRIKLGEALEENLIRLHPTENIHSDSWAGESSQSVTVMIPLFGDTDNNYVKFYSPPDNFDEEWLGSRESYRSGEEIAKLYKEIDFVAKKGTLLLSDFSTLHSSSRNKNAGMRISIDTTFALKRDTDKEVIHSWRENERASTEVVNHIGEKYLFVFPDSIDQQVDSQGGFKHPTNLLIKQIND